MKVAYTIDDKEKTITMTPNEDGWKVIFKDWNIIQPAFDYVLIEKDEEKTTTSGGLVIPESMTEKPSTGTVVAVGSGALTEQGVITPMIVNIGDRIIFPKLAGKTVKINNIEKTLLKQTDILGIIH